METRRTEAGQIALRGLTYKVFRCETIDRETGEVYRRYELVGKRGAKYYTVRNVPSPELMFVVPARGFSPVLDGVWLTDRSGTLEQAWTVGTRTSTSPCR